MQAIDTISAVLMLGSLPCVRDIHMLSVGDTYKVATVTHTNTPFIHTYPLPPTHPTHTKYLIHGFLERLSEIFDHALETAFEQIRQQRPGHIDTLVFAWRVSVWGFRV